MKDAKFYRNLNEQLRMMKINEQKEIFKLTPWKGDEFDEDVKNDMDIDSYFSSYKSDNIKPPHIADISSDDEIIDLDENDNLNQQIVYESEEQKQKCIYLHNLLAEHFQINFDPQNENGLSNREFESRIKDIQERYDKFANIKDYEESKIFINDKSLQKVVRKVVSAETQTDNAVEIIVPEIVKDKELVYFAGPDLANSKSICKTIRNQIDKCKSELLICSYSIGNGVLSECMIKKLSNNLKENFKVITDQQQCLMKSMLQYTNILHENGVKIRMNTVAKISMHCKFMVIDRKLVIYGSMNLGEKSLKNYEHITISKDEGVIEEFILRFNEMWEDKSKMTDFYYNGDNDIEFEDEDEEKKIDEPITVD